jgi:tetratricopeptide (TPR) repeat protein
LTEATPSLRQSKSDKLYAVYLLLGDMYKQQHEYKKAVESFDQALTLIKSLSNQKDRVLEIEVELARSDCLVRDGQSRNAIDDLQKLAKSLKLNDTDTKRISLKVIVYDTLARYCLIEKKYELFDNIAEESMILKLRSFSQYHPSLAINLILIAERHSQEFHYREALYFYEQALEVQCLNLTNNHPKIKKICYAIGDIYCKIDKLSNAMEKYDVAEDKNSSTDDDDVLQQDKLNSEESIEIFMARISMYRHLAEFHANKQVYKEAITQMNKIIDLLKEELPSSIFEISDETILIKKSFDQATVLSNLRQLASCYMHLGDILSFEQEDQKGYKEALIIYKKLFQYEKESARANLVLINQKLSKYYEKRAEYEDALDYFQETMELEGPTIAILYRLGHLNFYCDKLDEGKRNYEKILLKQSDNEQTTLRQIIKEKLLEAQEEGKKSHRRWSTSSSESGESRHNSAVSNSSNKRSRNATNASITSGQRTELNRDINADSKGQLKSANILYFKTFVLFKHS